MSIVESLATCVDTIGPRLRLRAVLTSDLFNSRPDISYVSFPECIIRYCQVEASQGQEGGPFKTVGGASRATGSQAQERSALV